MDKEVTLVARYINIRMPEKSISICYDITENTGKVVHGQTYLNFKPSATLLALIAREADKAFATEPEKR